MTAALLPLSAFAAWLAAGERGLSSESIVAKLTGHRVGSHNRGDHPWDAGDFRRCILLLDAVPAAREHLTGMADVSPEWAALTTEWGHLEASLRDEAGGDLTDRRTHAPRTSARIHALLNEVTTRRGAW